MDAQQIFYVIGGVLVVAALVISYVGVRGKDSFPSGRGAMIGGIAVFGVLILGTAAFAVTSAREEQDHRNQELAEEEALAEEGAAEQKGADAGASPEAQQQAGASEGGQPQGVPEPASEELAVSSPEDGSLAYEPPELQGAAGTITLAYDNPSPIVHNINLEVEQQTVAESDDVAAAATSISAELAPGEYIYFCSIPGHREGGMEGVLTVE